jgi:hypothetical protein
MVYTQHQPFNLFKETPLPVSFKYFCFCYNCIRHTVNGNSYLYFPSLDKPHVKCNVKLLISVLFQTQPLLIYFRKKKNTNHIAENVT